MDEGSIVSKQMKYLACWCLMLTASFPFEMVRTRLQTTPQLIRQGLLSQQYNGVIHCVKEISSKEGIRAFWKGNTANLLRLIPNQFITFSIKQFIRLESKKYGLADKHSMTLNFASSSIAACVTLCVIYPMQFARARLNNDIRGDGSIRKYLVNTYKLEGLRGIYRGSINYFISTAIFRAFYFGGFDTFKQNNPHDLVYRLSHSYFSSLTAMYSVYAFDTIRKRMMMTSGHSFKYRGFGDCFMQIYRKEGLRGYFKGWQMSMGQAASATVSLTLLDGIVSQLKKGIFHVEQEQ